MSRGRSQPPGQALVEAVQVMDRLRSPGGCPWDAEQTHISLVPYAIEEAHEVAEAAESGDPEALRDELGDLLLQVLFHARIATESADGFDIDDVARALIGKLTHRHPHVFAADGERGLTAQQVTERWEGLKAAERPRTSVLEGIPVSMPALARAAKMLGRIRNGGIAIGPDGALTEVRMETADGDAGGGAGAFPREGHGRASDPAESIGLELLDVVRRAQDQGVDAEAALRAQLRRLDESVRAAERAPANAPRATPAPAD